MKILFFMLFSINSLCCLASSDKWVIGLDADMSAVAANGGLAIEKGALLAISEINANGGVLGRQIELKVLDHRGNPARGIDNIIAFSKDENLIAVIGGVHTPVALAELETIHNEKIIYLDPWAAGTSIVDNGYQPNYVFRVSVRDEHAGEILIQAAINNGTKKVGLLLERTGWGRSNEISMKNAAKKHGVEISSIQWFNWGEKDFSEQNQAFLDNKVDAILLVANAPEGAAFMKQLVNERLFSMPIFSHWGIAGGSFVNALGLDVLNQLDLTVLQTFSFSDAQSEIEKNVLKNYREMFDFKLPNRQIPAQVGTAHSYDLVHLLILAIKKANTVESGAVLSALESNINFKGLVKEYAPAFSKENHDALTLDDYILSQFDENGFLVPVE